MDQESITIGGELRVATYLISNGERRWIVIIAFECGDMLTLTDPFTTDDAAFAMLERLGEDSVLFEETIRKIME